MTSFYLSNPYEPPRAPKTLPLDQPWPLFGGISPQSFMKTYWHKKPLVIRGAIPAFKLAQNSGIKLMSPLSPEELFKIAGNPDSETRLIQAKPWRFSSGPYPKKSLPNVNRPDWTLLLQGMEAHHLAAANVLSWFRFIPDARLDDLMISIAGPGGGVGPHFDSYDVFLIQMAGRRHWRISEQKDLSLNPKLPLKILKNFQVEQEWVLEPGDMLYLPPQIAHDGIAMDAGCQTWSVGFRSQSFKELLQEGLWRLAESLEDLPELEKYFADPKQKASARAEQLPEELIKQVATKLQALKLNQVETFLPGITAYLSEPKQQAIFAVPDRPLSLEKFNTAIARKILKPHPQTRILSLGNSVFCNGENVTQDQPKDIQLAWRKLSSQKDLVGQQRVHNKDISSLYVAYKAGWLVF